MASVVFIILLLLALVFILPIAALIKASNLSDELNRLRHRVRMLESELEKRRSGMGTSNAAPQPPEALDAIVPAVAPDFDPLVSDSPATPVQPVMVELPADSPSLASVLLARTSRPETAPVAAAPPLIPEPQTPVPEHAAQSAPVPPPAPAVELPKTPPAKPVFSLEQFMGVKLLAWVGGFAAFLFVALGLKYSFDNNLISPATRVACGFLFGLALVIGGILMRRRDYDVLSQTLCATGVVALYACAFAGHTVYHFALFGTVQTFALMTAITVGAFVLAVRLDGQVVGVLGMLGGFLTPVIVSTGQGNPLALFGYIGLLDAGLVAVVLNRRWTYMILLAAVGTIITQQCWVDAFFTPDKIGIAQAVFIGFAALFLVGAALAKRKTLFDDKFVAGVILAAASAFTFGAGLIRHPSFASHPGQIFAIVFAADLSLMALVLLAPHVKLVQSVGGSVVFILLAVWMRARLSEPLLYWALGLCLAFAALHSVFPILLQRWRPDAKREQWPCLFPAAGLVLMIFSIFILQSADVALWLAVLLIDVLAVGMAALTGSLLAIILALGLSLVAASAWICGTPVPGDDQWMVLLVIGGMAVFFIFAALWAGERIVKKMGEIGPVEGLDAEDAKRVARWMPASSALLPFVLLIMVIAKLNLESPNAVFSLAAFLGVLLLGMSYKFSNALLPAAGLAGTLALEFVWHFHGGRYPNVASTSLIWDIGFFAMYFAFPLIFSKRFAESQEVWGTAALSGALHFYFIYDNVAVSWDGPYKKLLPLAFVLPYAGALLVAIRSVPRQSAARNAILAWMAGAGLFFVTLFFPIQFTHEWLTLGWAMEGAALLWLRRRVPHDGLRWVGSALLFVAFLRLAINPAVLDYHPRTGTPILNWYFYAYLVVAASLFAAARLVGPAKKDLDQVNLPPVFYTLSVILVFLLVNIEIADFFSEGTTVTFQFSGNFARDMSYTIAWSIFAFGLVVLGVWKKTRVVRYSGLALIAVVVLKLFFHDLARLGQLYRLGALISVAAILMLASFVYQRFLKGQPPENTGANGKQ